MEDFNNNIGNDATPAEPSNTPPVIGNAVPLVTEKKPRTVKLTTVVVTSLIVCYFLAFVVFLLISFGYVKIGTDKNNTDILQTERFQEIYALLKQHYVGEMDEETMLRNALIVYAASVGDPYTEYLPKEAVNQYIDGAYGNQSGIGVRVYQSENPVGILIQYVFPDSPADKAGVKKGDIVTAVDDFVLTAENYNDAVNKVSGEEGSTVTLTVLRGEQTLTLPVVRGSYTINSVEYTMLKTASGIGYIRIDGVASNTAEEFKSAIEALKAQGAEKYVFDVRDDGGGYLDTITKILDMLLPEGPIVRWTLADGTEKANNSDSNKILDAPIAVLINGNTASAAELFAAALKDYELATLVGETTYGKGVMQTIFPLKNGDALKITTAYYNPPFSDNYNGVGVKPDIEVALPEGEAYFSVSEEEDLQLQAAIKALADK